MTVRAPASLVPPSVADLRGRAFGVAMERALAGADFRKLLVERVRDVDARLLPFLVREFSLEEFVEPDLRESAVRDLLAGAYDIHARKGYVDGVRRALASIGLRVSWRQWFQMTPPGAPGTHEATILVGRRLYAGDGPLIDERVQRLAARFVDHTKRWSQDVALRLGVGVEATLGLASRSQGLAVASLAVDAAPPPLRPRAAAGLAARAAGVLVCAMSARASARPAPRAAAGLVSRAQALAIVRCRMEAAA